MQGQKPTKYMLLISCLAELIKHTFNQQITQLIYYKTTHMRIQTGMMSQDKTLTP